ncbi:hypothetical protein A4H97_33620 [Niastella yeongjuensis]|uniref:Uncharacterized protein n=1 Tax=Niastella yeongjuensis TaxID=354355 RepID=A0A1V9EDV8_9BACT|nr:hypothetical protein [Niastella yeongjuensis]OQP44144.1 hypothetical protein A4H97_33620 [Niastella yeongjuensis]
MKMFLPILFAIAFINAKAQTNKTISPSPWQSNLVTVHAADSFIISPHLQFNGSSHHFLKGVAKTLGAGAVTYQASKVTGLPSKTDGPNASNAVLPAVGVGMAVGIPELVKGFRKNRYPTLVYAFYSKNSVLLKGGTVSLKKRGTVTIKGVAPADGFMQVTLLNGNDLKLLAGDVDIKVKPKNETVYKGSMAGAMNLTVESNGCLPQVIVCQPPTTQTTTFSDQFNTYIVTCTTSYSPNEDNTDCEEDYDCETITIPNGGGDPGGGGDDPGDGGDPGGDPGGGGGGSNSGGISNNTQDPCVNTPVTSVTSLPGSNTTAQALANAFGANSSLNLIFNEVVNNPNGKAGQTTIINSTTIEIDMSKQWLDGSAKEWAAAAVLHEIYHAYLLAQDNLPIDPNNLGESHEYMMEHYTDDIAAALKNMFPGLNDATATALALGGYGDVQASNPTLWNDTLNNNNLTNAQVTHVNSYYETALEGTPCH